MAEDKPSEPAKDAKEKDAAKPQAAAPEKKINPWIPVAVVAILAPALTFAVAQFVILPRMNKMIQAASVQLPDACAAEEISQSTSPNTSSSSKDAAPLAQAANTYEFKGVVANLSGSLQSRYIKVSFTVEGTDPKLAQVAAANRAKLLDATISILSQLTINDLEQPGIRNVLRSDLLNAYETVLGSRIIKELYFSEWVVQ